MAKRLVQGAAAPVYICDGDGRIIDQDAPLDVRVNQDTPLKVQLEPVASELENSIEGTVATAGNTQVGPTPAATERIVITAFQIQNETATATTVLLKDGIAPAAGRWRVRCPSDGGGAIVTFDGQHPLRLSAGNRITLNLSVATTVGYSFQFYRETA